MFQITPKEADREFDPLVIATETFHVIDVKNKYGDRAHIGPAGCYTLLQMDRRLEKMQHKTEKQFLDSRSITHGHRYIKSPPNIQKLNFQRDSSAEPGPRALKCDGCQQSPDIKSFLAKKMSAAQLGQRPLLLERKIAAKS